MGLFFMKKTTDEDFKIFKEEARKWIEVFGLYGWHVFFYHVVLDEFEDCATCSIDLMDRICTIRLNKDWEEATVKEIRRVAFHEVCELLFARIEEISNGRGYNSIDAREEVHNLINTLEKVIYNDRQER